MINNKKNYTFDELFYPLEKGTQKLTEFAIYRSLDYPGDLIPLWGGNQEHKIANQYISTNTKNKVNASIKVFDGDCLIVSLDGSAGSLTYKEEGVKFALNHHAGVLRCRDKNKIDLEYFKFKYENFLRDISVSDGSKTLSKKILEKQIFEIPDIAKQIKDKKCYLKLNKIKDKINQVLEKCNKLLEKDIILKELPQEFIPLRDVFSYISRNDFLSEEGIYKSSSFDDIDKIKVLSGGSENIEYGEIPINTPNIHFLKDRQGLHLVTRGSAGRLTYIPVGRYATNTNAFILYLKKNQFKIVGINNLSDERCYLKFLKLYLEPKFFQSASFADVSIFPLTELMKTMSVPYFKLTDDMRIIVEKYDKVLNMQSYCKNILFKIDKLISKDLQ